MPCRYEETEEEIRQNKSKEATKARIFLTDFMKSKQRVQSKPIEIKKSPEARKRYLLKSMK